jgi:cytidine deaminase
VGNTVSLIQGEKVVAFTTDLTSQEQELLRLAKEQYSRSHALYGKTGHKVGAAVLVKLPDGQFIYHASANFEVKPRSGTCAEDGAVLATQQAGHAEYAQAIAIIHENGDGTPATGVPYPCPASRGWICELAGITGLREGFPVIMSTTNFERIVVTTLGVLLPHAFDYP